MSRSLAKSGKAIVTKSLKEKWESSIQSTRENGENKVGASSTITVVSLLPVVCYVVCIIKSLAVHAQV